MQEQEAKLSALIEYEPEYCEILKKNKPKFNGKNYEGADLLAGGVPCPPFSVELLNTLINGRRLKDISDLPLDLAV